MSGRGYEFLRKAGELRGQLDGINPNGPSSEHRFVVADDPTVWRVAFGDKFYHQPSFLRVHTEAAARLGSMVGNLWLAATDRPPVFGKNYRVSRPVEEVPGHPHAEVIEFRVAVPVNADHWFYMRTEPGVETKLYAPTDDLGGPTRLTLPTNEFATQLFDQFVEMDLATITIAQQEAL